MHLKWDSVVPLFLQLYHTMLEEQHCRIPLAEIQMSPTAGKATTNCHTEYVRAICIVWTLYSISFSIFPLPQPIDLMNTRWPERVYIFWLRPNNMRSHVNLWSVLVYPQNFSNVLLVDLLTTRWHQNVGVCITLLPSSDHLCSCWVKCWRVYSSYQRRFFSYFSYQCLAF